VPTAALPIDDCQTAHIGIVSIRQQPHPHWQLLDMDLGELWLRAVCWQNAASLFGLAGSGS
jgi:hypothetical protein